MTLDRGMAERRVHRRRSRWVAPCLMLCLACAGLHAAEDSGPLRRSFVPADQPETWPAGEWERVPLQELAGFEESLAAGESLAEPPPQLERVVFRGALIERSVLEGGFTAQVRRLDPRQLFLELGAITPAMRQLSWSDGPAVWGTASDGRTLLYVDRGRDELIGEWALRSTSRFDGEEFDLRLPRASSIRLELLLPNDLELTSSDGLVLLPQPAENGQRLWSIELGRTSSCVCTVAPAGGESVAAAPSVEWTAVYSIQPDGCRLQWDFNVLFSSSAPSALEFEIPDGLEAPEATTAANVGLPGQLVTTDGRRRLIVPMPAGASGRLGTIRINSVFVLRDEDDWALPEVRLAGATTVNGVRRVHVDRPLTLQSLKLHGLRQTEIQLEESGGTWGFEDLTADAQLIVSVGRPATSLSLRAVTAVELSADEARFRSAVQLTSHGDSVYSAELRLPEGWGVIDVVMPAGESAGMSSWRATETDQGVLLGIEFRQALTSHAPRQVLISGRRVSWNLGTQEVELFPRLAGDAAAESHVVLAVRRDESGDRPLTPAGGARALAPGESTSDWAPLAGMLNVQPGDAAYAWFAHAGRVPQGVVSGARTELSTSPDGRAPSAGGGSGPETDAPLVLDVRLESDVGAGGARWHRHRAQFLLGGRRPDAPPKIRLPAGLELDSVMVDGRKQNIVISDQTIELLEWSAQVGEVEIRYRSPAQGSAGWLHRPVEVELPDWGQFPRQLEWRLQIPSTERLSEVRVPRSTVSGAARPGWMHRIFGALARESEAGASANSVAIGALAPGATVAVDLVDVTNQQRAGWLGLTAACLAVCGVRVWRRGPTRAAWWGVAVLVLCVFALPDGWGEVCGSVLIGALMGLLLPRGWLVPLRVGSAGAGSVVRPVSASAGAVLAMLCALQGVQPADAQSELPAGAPTADAPQSAGAEFDVLVPVRDGAALPEARIQRRLLPAFNAWRDSAPDKPDWLLQRARYVFTGGATPQLQAEFTVAVIDRRPLVPVKLPFGRLWVSDPDDCRIDGQPAQIRPSADSSALLVEVPGAPAGDGESVRTVLVELRLQPGAAARSGSGWEFDVPPVVDAELTLPPGAAPSEQLAAGSQWSVANDDAGHPVYVPGAVDVLSVQPATVSAAKPTDRLIADAVSLIEVHPLRLRVRTQLTMSAPAETGVAAQQPRLRLLLPAQADVREVLVAGLRRFFVRPLRGGLTLLDLELERPLAADATVLVDFSVPASASGGTIVIPPMPLREGGGLRSHRLGLRGASGIALERSSTTAPSGELREMPAELFTAGLATDTAWPVPTHVYVATAPKAIPVTLRPVEPLRSASLEQSLVVDAESIRWQGTAEIDVAVAPAFRHQFELSADVDLESVTLVQDGAERLLDWAHHGDRLVLYLLGDRIGHQEVRLSGVLRADAAQATPFARFELLDATTIASELLVQSGPSRRLELYAGDGTTLPVGPTSGATAAGGAPFIRRFSLQDAALPVAFRSFPAPAALSLTVVSSIEQRDGAWQLRTEFRGDRPLGADESLIVRVPGAWVGRVTPVLPTVAVAGDSDDTLRLSQLGGSDRPTSILTLSAPLEVPERGAWPAPRFEVLQATVSDELLIVPQELPFIPAIEAASIAEPGTWPSALREGPARLEASAGTVVYRWKGPERWLTKRTSAIETPDIRLVETAVWRDRDASVAGTTTFWMVARQSTCEVRLPWPGSARLISAGWDDQPLVLQPGADAHVLCRRDQLVPGTVHRLRIDWESAVGAIGDAGGALWRPRCEGATGATEVAAILPRTGYFALPGAGHADRDDALRRRADALLGVWDAAVVSASVGGGREELAAEIEATLSALGGRVPGAAESLRAEWVKRQSPSADVRVVANGMATTAPFAALAVRDDRAVLINLSEGAPGISIHEVHYGLALAASGIAAALVAVLLWQFRRFGRRAVAWAQLDRGAVGVCLLGAGWWLWLKLGVIGLVLVAAGLAMQWRAWRGTVDEAPGVDG